MRRAVSHEVTRRGLLVSVGVLLAAGLGFAGFAAAGGAQDRAARFAGAPGSIQVRAVTRPTVRPAWSRKRLTVRAGSMFAVTLDPTTAKACGVAVIGPYEGQQVTWNFKTSGLLLKLKLRTNVDATPGHWTLRASCGQANGKPPLVAKMLLVVRGAANGRGLVAEHRALRVRQVPLVAGKDSGRVQARGAGGNPFSLVECVSWAWEKRSDIYNRAVAAGVHPNGLRPHPAFKYDYVWNAKYWAENAAVAGIPEGPTPVVGAIGVYTQGNYGHVVYVEHVNGDGSFNFTQRNGTGCECTSAVTSGTDTARAGLVFVYGGPAGNGPGPPPFNPGAYNGHIVKQDNGNVTAWLVTDGHRNWIKDQATYNCLKSAGHPGPDLLSAAQLNQLPDQKNVLATCLTPPVTTVTITSTTPTTPTTIASTTTTTATPPPPTTWSETTGGVAHTWTNWTNAGGTEGPTIGGQVTVQIACKLPGFKVADGNTWWYRIAQAPWSNQFYVSADAFYNNGATSGSLSGTPYVDPNVPNC